MPFTFIFQAEMIDSQITLPKKVSSQVSLKKGFIEGVINYFPIRVPFESGKKGVVLTLSSAIIKACKIKSGEKVNVEITRIGDENEVRIPKDVSLALKASKNLNLWGEITPLARRDWILWAITPKQEKTRKHRIDVMCDKLSKGKGRVCCFPGIHWMTKDYVKKEETWCFGNKK